jgi:hypothetical protein
MALRNKLGRAECTPSFITAILSLPQVHGQSEDHQAQHWEEGLLHYGRGNDGLLKPINDGYLDDDLPDHDEAHGS